MIKTLSPYSNSAKTAEIMSRYKPIAPKPEIPMDPSSNEDSSISQKIRQSPYLRNLWPQLQARPTRTRKRGRAVISQPTTPKRPRNQVYGLSFPCSMTPPCTRNLSLSDYPASGPTRLPIPNLGGDKTSLRTNGLTADQTAVVTLPFLPCPPSELNFVKDNAIDLNIKTEIPELKDFLQQLQGHGSSGNVITPQPVRPVGSVIYVGPISEDPSPSLSLAMRKAYSKPEEVEKEVESEPLPVVVSDSNNKVKVANSAYKEMVGQPKCSWLDSMVTGESQAGGGGTCMRISGEVMLHLSDSIMVASSTGFSCWVKIEWESDGKRNSVDTFCDVIRLSCESRDYILKWRFHTRPKGFSIHLQC